MRINFERQLKQQDEELTKMAVQYFNSVYQKTPEDAKELASYLEILTDSKHNADVKGKLDEFLELATGQNK